MKPIRILSIPLLMPALLMPALLMPALLMPGCASATTETTGSAPSAPASNPAAQAVSEELAESWYPLVQRLTDSGLYGADVEAALVALGAAPSQDPMGQKITELYKRAFIPRAPKDPNAPKIKQPSVYKGTISAENLQKCRDFMDLHKDAFAVARARYGVPPEVAVSLLFVETRLGSYMGKKPAFLTLASMAASRRPEQINGYLAQLPNTDANRDWIMEKMNQRSNWAYKELTAFINFARQAKIDPLSAPGSIYGAIGLCQFMPSNLESLGADGNDDGIVNLFEVPDAVASLSNYLVINGWKAKASREIKLKVLRRYNNSMTYANTILTMSEALSRTTPTKAPAKATAKKPVNTAKATATSKAAQ